ncbi:MAG: hypothetical protein WDZ45_10005 [Flavobacteriaceae bacterium]
MIKFFRQIRKKLIEQSKVRNYFFYAIGEIILVVIGILIAENLAPTRQKAGGFSRIVLKTNNNYQTARRHPSLADWGQERA